MTLQSILDYVLGSIINTATNYPLVFIPIGWASFSNTYSTQRFFDSVKRKDFNDAFTCVLQMILMCFWLVMISGMYASLGPILEEIR